MRQFLLFILPILSIVIVGIVFFALIQTRIHDEKVTQELKKRVRTVSESTELVAAYILEKNNLLMARRLTGSFERRATPQGYILYWPDGKIMSITNRIADLKIDRDYIHNVVSNDEPYEHFINVNGIKYYSYVLPVHSEGGNLIGLSEFVHEISKPQEMQTAFWKRLSIFLIVLCSALILLTLMLQRRIFLHPVKKVTSWFRSYIKGETTSMRPVLHGGHLGEFASEVEQIALSLKVAKRSISKNAATRLEKDEMWTEAKLKNLIHARLGENSFFVVSNREPLMHKYDKVAMAVRTIIPAGGVVTAIHPILEACGGTWIAHGSGDHDKKYVNSRDKLGIPADDVKYILKRVWLTKEEEEGYYYGFSNEGLWPLCHNTHTRPIFRENDWRMYEDVNRKFAESVLQELPANNPIIFIQDYHFTLLAKFIRERRPDATIALFWHIPWPTAEAFSICPYYQKILDGLLGCDLLGFHLQSHCNNFIDTTNRLLESRVDNESNSIVRLGKETFVRPFPISIDSTGDEEIEGKVFSDLVKAEKIKNELLLQNMIVGIGVDRIDYTKGIIERFLAIERFLEKYPIYKGKFVFIQIGSPSRTHIKAYHDFTSDVDVTVERINWKFAETNWSPIIYLKKHFDSPDILPYYIMANLCIVSSLHDGMNLVAKEYVSAKKDNDGVLILSQFAGASKELGDALIINPYSIEEFSEAIYTAVEMPDTEVKARMRNMREQVKENNVYKWAGNIITELINISNRKKSVSIKETVS